MIVFNQPDRIIVKKKGKVFGFAKQLTFFATGTAYKLYL